MLKLTFYAILMIWMGGGYSVNAQTERSIRLVQDSASEPRVALVIGNANYRGIPALKNPANDAEDIANSLRGLSFDVTLVTNVTQREMKQAIRAFGSKLKQGGVGLFYFAGHGVQLRGRNYLIPIAAIIDSEAEIEDESVDVNLVLALMEEAGNRVNIVILDACRNNPFPSRVRAIGAGLAQMDPAKGTFIAYATAPGAVALDGNGRNGIYTERLLASLKHPDGDIDKVFRRVAGDVSTATKGRQVPWVASSLTGDFYFRAPISKDDHATKYQQIERERAQLTKELEAERRQREKDAAELKREMEQLRTELDCYRNPDTGGSCKPIQVALASTSPQQLAKAPLGRPAQQHTLPPPPKSPPPAPKIDAVSTSVVPAPLSQAAIEAKPSESAGNAVKASAIPSSWDKRLVVLESLRGQLTLSKALAIALDVGKDDDLTLLLEHEAALKRDAYPSAFALGVGDGGVIRYGRAWTTGIHTGGTVPDPSGNAVARCRADSCQVVMRNGSFQEGGFWGFLKGFGTFDPASAGERYLRSLRDLREKSARSF